jgi:pimeloyl-ACP methyl ester carboxylesterase
LDVEAIPALFSHLGIRHIAVGCHSGGTIYALDLLLHHPVLLHPERPYLAIGAPWILPSHTDSTLLSIIQLLPAGIIGMSDRLQKLINNHIDPAIGMAFGVSAVAVSKLRPKTIPPVEQLGLEDPALLERNLYNETIERIYKEGIQGTSQDSIVFMQKVNGMNGWDTWSDYDALVPLLSEALRAAERKLTIDVLYAENDSWIGNRESRGPLWFDQCWKTEGTAIDYTSVLVKQADHNNVWDLSSGAVQRVFERISQTSGDLL